MGCVCAKARVPHEDSDSPKEKTTTLGSATGTTTRPSAVRRPSATAKVETADNPVYNIDKEKDRVKAHHRGSSKQNGNTQSSSLQPSSKQQDDTTAVESNRRRDRSSQQLDQLHHPRLSSNPPKNLEGEQVAAGWPGWLSAVAGEAIKGWIPRHAASFEKLDKVSGDIGSSLIWLVVGHIKLLSLGDVRYTYHLYVMERWYIL